MVVYNTETPPNCNGAMTSDNFFFNNINAGPLQLNVTKGTQYCFFAGTQLSEDPESARTATLTYSIPAPGAAGPGTLDGPLPPWTYVVLGLALWWIARKQLAQSSARV